MIHKIESETGHDFEKTNVVTLGGGGKKKMHDNVVCKNCGVKAKRYSLTGVSFYEKDKHKVLCKSAPKEEKVKILRFGAAGPWFANLVAGSIHNVIPTPDGEKEDLKGVWVMGVGKPVKVLNGEFIKV